MEAVHNDPWYDGTPKRTGCTTTVDQGSDETQQAKKNLSDTIEGNKIGDLSGNRRRQPPDQHNNCCQDSPLAPQEGGKEGKWGDTIIKGVMGITADRTVEMTEWWNTMEI